LVQSVQPILSRRSLHIDAILILLVIPSVFKGSRGRKGALKIPF